MPKRILIVEDEVSVRNAVRIFLEQQPRFEVCGEAANGEEAVSETRRLKPDLLILDISLPDSSGLEVAMAIRRIAPDVSILLLSAYGGKQLIEEVKRRGFEGFISKSDAAKTLLGAVDAIVNLKQGSF